jgi:hypothetical protein
MSEKRFGHVGIAVLTVNGTPNRRHLYRRYRHVLHVATPMFKF